MPRRPKKAEVLESDAQVIARLSEHPAPYYVALARAAELYLKEFGSYGYTLADFYQAFVPCSLEPRQLATLPAARSERRRRL